MVIYKIQNRINGKIYIGQTNKTADSRFKSHRNSRVILGKAIRKYGTENFDVSVIDTADNRPLLCAKEMYWIEKYKSKHPKGYNLTDGGEGLFDPCQEVRDKISASCKGYKHTEETKEKFRNRRWSPEEKEKRSVSVKKAVMNGRIPSRKGMQSPMKGEKHSEITKAKIREKRALQVTTPETREKMAESQRGSYKTGKRRSLKGIISPKKGIPSGIVAWNKGLTGFLKGKVAWNKGLTKESDPRLLSRTEKISGLPAWNKGLTKENDERVKGYSDSLKNSSAAGVFKKGQSAWNKGIPTVHTEESNRKRSLKMRGIPKSPETIERMKMAQQLRRKNELNVSIQA